MTDPADARPVAIDADRCRPMPGDGFRGSPVGDPARDGRVQDFLRVMSTRAAAGPTRRPRAVSSTPRRAAAARGPRRLHVTAGATADRCPLSGTWPHAVPYKDDKDASPFSPTPLWASSCRATTVHLGTTGPPSCLDRTTGVPSRPDAARSSTQRSPCPVPARRAADSRGPVGGPHGSPPPVLSAGRPSPWRRLAFQSGHAESRESPAYAPLVPLGAVDHRAVPTADGTRCDAAVPGSNPAVPGSNVAPTRSLASLTCPAAPP